MTPDWSEWKGTMHVKMETAEQRLHDIETRMEKIEEKVSDVVSKLAVPIFLAGISGPFIGAIIVFVITKGFK